MKNVTSITVLGIALSLCACSAQVVAQASPPTDLAVAAAPDLSPFTCSPACSASAPLCNAAHHCVVCLADADCPIGSVCKVLGAAQSQCVKGCATDERCRANGGAGGMACCGGQCVDTTASSSNCGGCGAACVVQNAVPKCAAGKCAIGTCNPGYTDCNADSTDGCETSVRVDPSNCTACGKTCAFSNGTAGCADGCYLAGCKPGYDDCDLSDANGCEVIVDNDARNCGGCGNVCNNPQHSRGSCVAGACAITCDINWGDCNMNIVDGCELSLTTDANNCGACGSKCAQGLVCRGGQCTCPNCNIPNASSKCVNNVCVLDKCNVGWSDCDNNVNNGCEVSTVADNQNCGACRNVCPMNMNTCLNSVCTNSPCIGNPQWTRVTCTTGSWVWSRNRSQLSLAAAAAARVLATGCNHGGPQPALGLGQCSLDGKGWVSTSDFAMTDCDQNWYHLGGSYTGNCGGHNGDRWRHLVLTDNDCFPY